MNKVPNPDPAPKPDTPPRSPPSYPEQDEAEDEEQLPDQASTVGKGMTYAAWALILVMLSAFFSNTIQRQRNPNQDLAAQTDGAGVPIVVLKRNRQGHYLATVRINGLPVEVLLDTGATTVTIPDALARRLGLSRGRPQATTTANGTIITYTTMLDTVQLGAIVLHRVRATINPRHNEVLLGMSFLKQLQFTQQGDVLILQPYSG